MLSTLPDVNVLVNSLGVFGSAPALEISDDEWRPYFETNVLSAVRLIRATLPGMAERGWGRVLNIALSSERPPAENPPIAIIGRIRRTLRPRVDG